MNKNYNIRTEKNKTQRATKNIKQIFTKQRFLKLLSLKHSNQVHQFALEIKDGELEKWVIYSYIYILGSGIIGGIIILSN